MSSRSKINDCDKCGGEGWLWGHELDEADEDTCADTMTKYTCDACHALPAAWYRPSPKPESETSEIIRLAAEVERLTEERDDLQRWYADECQRTHLLASDAWCYARARDTALRDLAQARERINSLLCSRCAQVCNADSPPCACGKPSTLMRPTCTDCFDAALSANPGDAKVNE